MLLLNVYAAGGKWWDLTANVDENRERKEMWRHSQIVPGLKRMTRDTHLVIDNWDHYPPLTSDIHG
jgi:hypothetical protein